MGHREIRRVRPDWCHPRQQINCREDWIYYHRRGDPRYMGQPDKPYIPLKASLKRALGNLVGDIESMGLSEALDFCGGGPVSWDYMPDWTPKEATHWQLYECTSEGTPKSPPRPTPESLAEWCADNKVSIFGNSRPLSADEWLKFIQGEIDFLPGYNPETGDIDLLRCEPGKVKEGHWT